LLLDKRYTKEMREIIMKYKSMHLRQQADEREFLNKSKIMHCEELNEFGQPKCGIIFSGK
jgi:hypothetical protein